MDDIESGDGKNFVSSGKADLDGNQQVDQAELDLINSQISDTSKLFDDDEWMCLSSLFYFNISIAYRYFDKHHILNRV